MCAHELNASIGGYLSKRNFQVYSITLREFQRNHNKLGGKPVFSLLWHLRQKLHLVIPAV